MLKAVEALANKAIRENVFPGCVVGVVRASGRRELLPFGRLTYESDSPLVGARTIYDLASITKSIPTASLALAYISEGRLRLGDTVKQHIPELQNDYGATIEDLLTYRVHGTPLSTLKDRSLDEILAYVFEHGFDLAPGEPKYTNLPALLLGILVERAAGDSLGMLAQERLFTPLGMTRTAFSTHVVVYETTTIAPTEIGEWRGEVRGMPHDESAYTFAKAGRAVGHAGLFSNAPDLLHFLEALLRGEYDCIVDGAQKGLGWQVNDSRFMGTHASAHAFGKTGFTGTSAVCDIERGIAFVILSNRTYPKRPKDDSAIFRFRADIADQVFQSI